MYVLALSWWKAKLKHEAGEEGAIGLIPATYVEEVCRLKPPFLTCAIFADLPSYHR